MSTQTQVTKTAAKKNAVTKPAQKKAGMFFFQQTPAGRQLRAYFIAFITLQTGGKLKAGATFKLWPHANIRGHLDTKKIVRNDAGLALSAAGYNYFTDPAQSPDAEEVKAFAKAISTGEKFKAYNFDMSPLK